MGTPALRSFRLFDHYLGGVEIHFRVAEVHVFKAGDNDPGDEKVAGPLFVGRDDIPRGMRRVGLGKDFLIGGHVIIPLAAGHEVGLVKLPVLFRSVEPLLQAFLLGIPINVQEKLDDRRALVGQHLLKIGNMAVALAPDALRLELVDPDGEHILIVAAVKDHDLAIARGALVHAPEVVVGDFTAGWLFEAGDVDALWIDPAEDVPDGAVFAAGIHALEDEEELFSAIDKKALLQIGQPEMEGTEFLSRLVLFVRQVRPRIGGHLGQLGVLLFGDQVFVKIAKI